MSGGGGWGRKVAANNRIYLLLTDEWTRNWEGLKRGGGAGVYAGEVYGRGRSLRYSISQTMCVYMEISAEELLVAVLINQLYQACCCSRAQIWAIHFFFVEKRSYHRQLKLCKKDWVETSFLPPPHPHLTHLLQSFQQISWVKFRQKWTNFYGVSAFLKKQEQKQHWQVRIKPVSR